MNREEVIDMAMDIFENTDATLEEAMGIALESSNSQVAKSPRELYDMNYIIVKDKVLRLVDKYNTAAFPATRERLAVKIAKRISEPETNYQLKACGCWNDIPKSIKKLAGLA